MADELILASKNGCWLEKCVRRDGSSDGTRAFHEAVDAVMQGVKVADYAEEYEELKVALTKWVAAELASRR